MDSTAEHESAILEIGKALSARAKIREPKIFHRRWWTDAVLEWSTRDEQFKVQLFRFIDVLPMLSTDEQFVRILHEYFDSVPSLPPVFRWFLRRLSTHSLVSQLGARVLRRQFLVMARRFLAGHSVEDALPVLARLWRDGCAFSVDILGEAIVSEREADAYQRQYLDALTDLHRAVSSWPSRPILERDHVGPIPRIQLSLKLSALYSQLDPIDPEGSYRQVAERLRPIVDRALALPASITVDMEQAELKDLTVYIFTRLFAEAPYRTYPHAGLAIQAYLKDSSETVDDLLAWVRRRGTPIGIRLVKGAYWDSEVIRYRQRGWPVPVFLRKAETDANYERLTEKLLTNLDLVRPALGTHNLRSLAHAQAVARTAGVAREAYEFQMLYGMAESLRAAVVDFGLRMRVYTPIGELIPGMAYLVRRLLENTSNESFMRRQHEAGDAVEALLRSPVSGNGDRPAFADASPPQVESPPSLQDEEGFCNEPHTDFSRAAARRAMSQAIDTVQQQLGQSPVYRIAGHAPPSGRVLESHDPSAPDRLVAQFRTVTPEDLDRVFDVAQRALPVWRAVAPERRAELLFKTAALIRMRRMELAAWEIFETGKPWREADADIAEAIDFLEYYGRQMIRLGTPRRLGRYPGELNHRVFSPRGIAVVLPPWNFPLAIPTGLVSAALVTGNVVLFKPSERAPMMGYHLYTLLREAGVPEDVVHFLPGGPELGRALVAHPAVHVIAFTGSKAVGLTIMAQVSQVRPGQRHLTHVIAEMGGKNAIIVD
ncbi:MAG: aldehyde dehydrogenase family protein, partial [Nitrospirae bacterium]